jgi:hypothetical protein
MLPTPFFYKPSLPPCFSVFIANGWHKDALITLERDGQSYDITAYGRVPTENPDPNVWPTVPASGIPQGEVAVVFLSHDPMSRNVIDPLACPLAPAISGSYGTAVQDTGRGKAWSVGSDVPVSVYDMMPYGGADSFLPSAGLILPTTTWASTYVVGMPLASAGVPWAQVTALEDGTTFDIVPTTDVDAAPLNTVTSYTLDAGEYIQWQLSGELSGSIIKSAADKPIALSTGNTYLCYQSQTSTGGGCDSGHQQIPPVRAWTHEYVVAPYATRRTTGQPESILYRIVGAADGTTLVYDPPIAGAPTTLQSREVFDFEAAQAFTVRAQDADHPFWMAQMMPGCIVSDKPASYCPGDEEFVNLPPPGQFLDDYVFFTDPSYRTTNLVLVRANDGSGFADVIVECHGAVTGWQDVGGDGQFQIAYLDIVRDGTPNCSCRNGPRHAESDAPFGLMVWGIDQNASYAYPAGGSLAPNNTVDIPAVPK